jgi:hypothetical protein
MASRARDLDQAAVDVGEIARGHGKRAVIADEGEQRLGDMSLIARGRACDHAAEPPAAERNRHVVDHAHGREQLGGLIGARDAGARHLPGGRAGELALPEDDAAAVGTVEAPD